MLYSAWLFGLYGVSLRLVFGDRSMKPDFVPEVKGMALVGGLVGIGCTIVGGPVELLKSQLQRSGSHYKNTFDLSKAIIRQYGFKALGQGFGTTLLRNTPGDMVIFTVYEMVKYKLSKNYGQFWGTLAAGGLGGASFWLTMYPVDVVKSRIQSDHLDPRKRQYKNMRHVFRSIYRTEGMAGFYKGFSICMLRSFPVNALSFVVYERAKNCKNYM
eukprot:TRINITY_DN4569_c0_g1_i1.p1 TRINITY_DN4569_c0_g1~~TRINITY_DN4569_c0_g1_i1.p1  ORF type:complete len:214 (+),score=20.64 TRINITY_DN4569_c0_g1_i1:329-970(+)